MANRPMQRFEGSCHCGAIRFHRKRVTPDYFGINVHCLEGFDEKGIPVRATVGAAMP